MANYIITFVNYDNTELQSESLEEGVMPLYTTSPPRKQGNEQYYYEFAGWSPELDIVTGDQVYTAVFTEHINQYTITWENYDGTILEVDENVNYGTTPTYNGQTPQKHGAGFLGWTPQISPVVQDTIYIATFKNRYSNFIKTSDIEYDKYEDGVFQGVEKINKNTIRDLYAELENEIIQRGGYQSIVHFTPVEEELDSKNEEKTRVDYFNESMITRPYIANGGQDVYSSNKEEWYQNADKDKIETLVYDLHKGKKVPLNNSNFEVNASTRAATGCNNVCTGTCSNTCGGTAVSWYTPQCTDCTNECFNTCTNSCGSNCSHTCGESCAGTCGQNCQTGCQSNCSGGCGGGCTGTCSGGCSGGCEGCGSSCTSDCSNSCGSGCATGCAGCTTTCSNSCSGDCDGGCGGGCKSSCDRNCANGCDNWCSGACGGSCNGSAEGYTVTSNGTSCISCWNVCVGTCGSNCAGTCAFGGAAGSCSTCGSGCSGGCHAGCASGCGSGCGSGCSGCSGSCGGSCSGGCDGCGGSCTDNCSGNCGGSCSHDCGNACTINCGNACTVSCGNRCTNDCATICKNNCISSCTTACNDSCEAKAISASSITVGNLTQTELNQIKASLEAKYNATISSLNACSDCSTGCNTYCTGCSGTCAGLGSADSLTAQQKLMIWNTLDTSVVNPAQFKGAKNTTEDHDGNIGGGPNDPNLPRWRRS